MVRPMPHLCGMVRGGLTLLSLLWLGCLCACSAPITSRPALAEPPVSGPYALVLGTAQDAGLPQIGCTRACCEDARSQPELRRLGSSLLIVDPASGGRWLLDASPDLREQVELARGHPPQRELPGSRPPLFDGIYLTHAHMGHVAGLLQLGREAYAAQATPVFGTESLLGFLADNEPWALLQRAGHLEARLLQPGLAQPLFGPGGTASETLSITSFRVPHRDELSDTVGYLLQGPRAALLFLPDIDKWERWDRPVESLLSQVDIALLDGTFATADELPGRNMEDIPHPFITESMARFGAAARAGLRSKIFFTHLNHSNPAAKGSSAASRSVREAGFHIASDGDIFEL